MENGTKLRLLYLYQYLTRHTDKDHPVSTPELMRYLKDTYGMEVNRTTIPDDFAMLEKAGIHCGVIRTRQNKYYFDGAVFDVPELKVLIDAVSSSKFITERESKRLIRKLGSLTSVFNEAKLRRHVTVEGRVKSGNERGYEIVDAVNTAITLGRKVRFQYTEYGVHRRRFLRNDGEWYVVSPYTLVWDGDYYYMIGWCDNREHTRNFRLDRIYKAPVILYEEPAVPKPKDFDLAEYSRRTFRMFGSDRAVTVELLCTARVMNGVIDQFGPDARTEPVDDEHFRAFVEVSPSPTFYSWVFGWQGDMKIVGPAEVRDEFATVLEKVGDGYR